MFSNKHVSLSVIEDKTTGMLRLEGDFKEPSLYSKRCVFAANPIDRMSSYSGSGLAFPNNAIAFENSPNYFEADASGKINAVFFRPNSYYAPDTYTRVVPSIFVKLVPIKEPSEPIIIQFKLEDTLPLKSRKEKVGGPEFYAKKAGIIGVRSQYDIMRMIENVKIQHNCA